MSYPIFYSDDPVRDAERYYPWQLRVPEKNTRIHRRPFPFPDSLPGSAGAWCGQRRNRHKGSLYLLSKGSQRQWECVPWSAAELRSSHIDNPDAFLPCIHAHPVPLAYGKGFAPGRGDEASDPVLPKSTKSRKQYLNLRFQPAGAV